MDFLDEFERAPVLAMIEHGLLQGTKREWGKVEPTAGNVREKQPLSLSHARTQLLTPGPSTRFFLSESVKSEE